MQDNKQRRHKVLVAVDGSDQSLQAVRYVGMIFPAGQTEVVLFNVTDKLPDLFLELKNNALYGAQMSRLQQWVSRQGQSVSEFMDSAEEELSAAGFPRDAVKKVMRQRKLDVERDVVKESYEGYSAVVVGRTGMSQLKDVLLKSLAIRLVDKIRHLPVIVVGGVPNSNRIFMAFDGSAGAMRGVSWVGKLLGGSDCPMMLYSLLSTSGRFWVGDEEVFVNGESEDPVEAGKQSIAPRVEEARDLLVEQGVHADRISEKIKVIETDRAGHIVEAASCSGFGSVVVGRRGLISMFEQFLFGRVSQKVLNLADDLAVWVI